METISAQILKKLYRLPKDSHKGQNGKLTIIGGSSLFHGASLWALKTASRIVDMVFYSTIPENEELTKKLKSEIYDFICIPQDKRSQYIQESDVVLIGPGLTREGETKKITQELLFKFPQKKWVIDAGSLQMMEANWLKKLNQIIITPHRKEFSNLFNINIENCKLKIENLVSQKANEYGCVIVLKGKQDIICSPQECVLNTTGNEGMTKGGTGDVLAGLIAGLACKNDLFLAAQAGIYINGLAGDELYKRIGPYFNASDLGEEIPKVLYKVMSK